ncbi:MAG: hypothetical protein WDK96_02265 [Candidatus Paceibacterota bacterium]|jgi:hypothetical protein
MSYSYNSTPKTKQEEIFQKWKNEISDLFNKGEIIVPEVHTRIFLKMNSTEILEDLHLIECSSENIKTLQFFIEEMVDHALSLVKEQGELKKIFGDYTQTGTSRTFPDLSYYDNRRDRYSNWQLAKHRATFGNWDSIGN